MTPTHPRWVEFYRKLGQLGTWKTCSHNMDGVFEVLNLMGGLDIRASIHSLKVDAGKCDCEIMLGGYQAKNGSKPFDPAESQ